MTTGIFKNFLFFIKKPDNNKKGDLTSSQKIVELLKYQFYLKTDHYLPGNFLCSF